MRAREIDRCKALLLHIFQHLRDFFRCTCKERLEALLRIDLIERFHDKRDIGDLKVLPLIFAVLKDKDTVCIEHLCADMREGCRQFIQQRPDALRQIRRAAGCGLLCSGIPD